MGSDVEFIEFIVGQIENVGEVTFKKMFGEYALYCEGKVVALICNNQLFIKPTKAGKDFIETVVEVPPYPKAKPYFLIEDQVENKEWLSQLVAITEKELPKPKPRKKKVKST